MLTMLINLSDVGLNGTNPQNPYICPRGMCSNLSENLPNMQEIASKCRKRAILTHRTEIMINRTQN